MFKLVLEKAEELEIKLPASVGFAGEGNGNLLQYPCLENPRNGGAWRAAVYGVAQRRTRLKQQQLDHRKSKRISENHQLLIQ